VSKNFATLGKKGMNEDGNTHRGHLGGKEKNTLVRAKSAEKIWNGLQLESSQKVGRRQHGQVGTEKRGKASRAHSCTVGKTSER